MHLRVDNLAKIKKADIDIDGITIIAGENNAGKSTIGKILYSMFNSLYDMDAKIERRRRDEIQQICNRYLQNIDFIERVEISKLNAGAFKRLYSNLTKDITRSILEIDNELFNSDVYTQTLCKVFKDYEIKFIDEQIDEFVKNTFEKIASRKKNDSHKIGQELIQRYFLRTFGSQIQCLKRPNEEAKVQLMIKGKDITAVFRDNQCVDWTAEYNILHEAFLLDDPFVLDDLSDYFYATSTMKGIRGDLQGKIANARNNIMEGLFEAVNAKENLKDIYDILNRVSEGDILLQNGNWELGTEQFEEPLNFENMSAGLKSFVLIKLLLEKGILKERDVLILDEPEIHLHPEWQLYYAEIIVLLQKKFDLSIVVTTHSMHFLEALELYAKKYDLVSKCKYYKANLEEGLVTFDDVTDKLDIIYKQMVTPSMLLDKLRYEMEKDNE